jgi:hypothetical protein
MSPSVSFYAWLNVRTTPASTVGGNIALTNTVVTPTTAGTISTALEYRAVRLTGAAPGVACNAAAFTGTPTFIAGTATTWVPVPQTPAPQVANPIGPAGATLGFCFEVRIVAGAPNSVQGTSATVTWTMTGTSN